MTALESTGGVVLAVGGMNLPTLLAIVTVVMMVISAVFFVAIAIGPHISSNWAERFHGAIPDVGDTDTDDGERTA